MASSSSSAVHEWDAQKMFDLYLHDYLVKKKMHDTAAIFKNEANVGPNRVVIDSPQGFLHEWWTLFYDMYSSRQPKRQENLTKASVKAEQMTQNELQNIRPIMPQLAMNQQKTGQFHIGTDLDKILAQPADGLLTARKFEEDRHLRHPRNFDPNSQLLDVTQLNPSNAAAISSSYLLQQTSNQAQQLVDNRHGISTGRPNCMDTALYGIQKGRFPITRSRDTGVNGGVNPALMNGWIWNSLSQAPNDLQHFALLTEQCQQNLLSQAQSPTSGNLTSAFPGSSANFDSQNLMLPNKNLIENDAQTSVQMKQPEEHQDQHLRQLLPENGRKRKKFLHSKAGDKTLDCENAEVDKPADENVESFLSTEDDNVDDKGAPFSTLERRSNACSKNDHKGFTFEEIGCLHSSRSKLLSCHFSSDGKILASAGHEKKVLIWNMETFDFTNCSEGHSLLITDVRFRPSSTIFATSSFDRTVQIWDADKPSKSLFKLLGHTEQVISLDFHPRQVDLLCSCDSNDEIRLWNVNQCSCIRVSKGGSKQVRFQPQSGKLLATATGNNINIVDVDIDNIQFNLKGHAKEVLSICWDTSGKYIASVSEDSARVWSLVSGGNCVHELQSNGNKFQSCTFHPGYKQLLIIGGYQSLEFWNPTEGNKTWSVPAHHGLIAALADSLRTEMIASASHDQCVKLWK